MHVRTARRVVDLLREEYVTFKAAGIAFYAVASIVPLLIVGLAVLSVFGAADMLVAALQSQLSESGQKVLEQVLSNTRGRGVAGVLGALFTLWSAMKVFRGLSIAFAEMYGRTSELSFLDQLEKSLLVLGSILFAVVVLSATSALLSEVPFRVPYPTLVWNTVAALILVLALLPLFYILPPVPVTVEHALPGTAITAVGWALLQLGFFYYAKNAVAYDAYGLLGAVLLFITFLYFAALVLLVGAAVNVALSECGGAAGKNVRGGRWIQP